MTTLTNAAPAMTSWRSRIVEHGFACPEDLIPHPLRWRTHSAAQSAAIAGSLTEVGWVRSVLVNRTSGFMLDGFERRALALARAETRVPVEYVELDEHEERFVLATLDPLAAMAGQDDGPLAELLAGIETADPALVTLLDDLKSRLAPPEEKEPGAGGDDYDTSRPPPGAELRTAVGQIWQLGPHHRLAVGDARDRALVEALMEGMKADLVFTDPPYGVAYEGGTADALRILNDDLGNDGTHDLVRDLLLAAPWRAGTAFYVCGPAGETETYFRLAIRAAGLQIRQSIVWVKHAFVLSRQDYHWRHEAILYGQQPGADPYFLERDVDYAPRHETLLYGWQQGAGHFYVDDRKQDTVWEFERPMRNAEHPTKKPVDLVAKAVRNSSRPGEIVYDCCGGSGSTLIAAERTNRRSRLVELDPRFADVILARWEAETGQKAALVEAR